MICHILAGSAQWQNILYIIRQTDRQRVCVPGRWWEAWCFSVIVVDPAWTPRGWTCFPWSAAFWPPPGGTSPCCVPLLLPPDTEKRTHIDHDPLENTEIVGFCFNYIFHQLAKQISCEKLSCKKLKKKRKEKEKTCKTQEASWHKWNILYK